MVALNKTYRKTLTPDRSAKDSGHRYYSPEISRWLNRDPIGERAFEVQESRYHFIGIPSPSGNLYSSFDNKPVLGIDPFGLQSWSGNPITGPQGPAQGDPGFYGGWDCCNGEIYHVLTECCCRGRVVRRAPIDTGVRTCEHSYWFGLPQHAWIEFEGGGSIGFYPNPYGPNPFHAPGMISSPDSSYEGGYPSDCEDVELSPCEYDIDRFVTKVKSAATIPPPTYVYGMYDCRHFLYDAINNALNISAGCTIPIVP